MQLSPSFSPSLFISLSLTGEQGALHRSERERERDTEREKKKSEKEREREIKRE
jgi:hypothetical protein